MLISFYILFVKKKYDSLILLWVSSSFGWGFSRVLGEGVGEGLGFMLEDVDDVWLYVG